MGKSGRRKAAAETADELRRDSTWPPRFVGLSRRRAARSSGALDFQDVTVRCFPLPAQLSRLELFCDRYLNMDIPRDVARFRPAAPYVLMAVVNYGRMPAAASNLGWSSQNEVLFSVPILGSWNQWNAPDGEAEGEAVTIRDFASVSPFMFVDDDGAAASGRELYGWPKVSCRLEAGLGSWLRNPRGRRRLLTLQTSSIREQSGAGRETRFETLLEVEQETARIEMPPDLEYVFNPLLRLSRSLVDVMAATPDLMRTLAQMAIPSSAPEGAGKQEATAAPVASMLTQLFRSLSRVPPDLYGNTIALKQFRAPLPRAASYQALNNSRMRLRRFNHGGLMGSPEMLRGDPTGGISILLRRRETHPIIECLGLRVDRLERRDGETAAVLKPVLPFWMSLDLRCERARRICWRAERPKIEAPEDAGNNGWHRWRGEERLEAPVSDLAAERLDGTVTRLPQFNTALGPVVEAVQGPFDFRDVTLRVLPLRASATRLREALPAAGTPTACQPVTTGDGEAWVFLVVTTYGRMSSAVRDLGWWARNEVGLAYVARSEDSIGLSTRGVDDIGLSPPETRTLHWLHWPYMFADSPVALTEGREVLGLPTTYCRLHRGEDPWLDLDGPAANDRLLRLDVLDPPALGAGRQAKERRLLCVERLVGQDGGDATEGAAGRSLVRDFIQRHLARFGEGVRVRNLSVKEFPDEESPDRPCYQSVVAFDRVLRKRRRAKGEPSDSGLWLRPMRGGYEVRFHSSPSCDIVDALGLEVARREEGPSGGETSVCRVVDPFWMKADIRAELPVDLLHRSVNRPWSSPGYLPFSYNELRFRDVYERQIEAFEKVMKTPGEGGEALPADELSAEAGRRMADLRREWDKDPTVWELETFGEVIRTLMGARPDSEREGPVEQGGGGELAGKSVETGKKRPAGTAVKKSAKLAAKPAAKKTSPEKTSKKKVETAAKPAAAGGERERGASKKAAPKKTAKKRPKRPTKKSTKKTALKRGAWPPPEELDRYAGKYRLDGGQGHLTFHRPFGEVVDGKATVEARGLLATTPTKSAFELVPGSKQHSFASTGKGLHRFDFSPAAGKGKGRVRYRYGKRSLEAIRIEDGDGNSV